MGWILDGRTTNLPHLDRECYTDERETLVYLLQNSAEIMPIIWHFVLVD